MTTVQSRTGLRADKALEGCGNLLKYVKHQGPCGGGDEFQRTLK